jgi:hypothetical protein
MTYLQAIKGNALLQLKSIYQSLFKTALSLLAVFFLVISTACNSSEVAAKKVERPMDKQSAGQITELYKPIAPREGGMNNYSDVDPRMDTSRAAAKTDRLINQADTRSRTDTNPLKEVKKELDRKSLKERAEDFTDSIGRSAKETTDGVAEGTQRGFKNLKENARSFKDDTKAAIDDLGQKARDKVDDM